MRVIQLTAGPETMAKSRHPLVAVPAAGSEVTVSLILPTLNVSAVGMLSNLGRGRHGGLAALARAGATGAGLAYTATGFPRIRWTRPAGPPQEVGSTLKNSSTDAVAEPVLPLVIGVNSSLGAIDARRVGQQSNASALCLPTRDGDPVAMVQ